jgi:hypothetical protein
MAILLSQDITLSDGKNWLAQIYASCVTTLTNGCKTYKLTDVCVGQLVKSKATLKKFTMSLQKINAFDYDTEFLTCGDLEMCLTHPAIEIDDVFTFTFDDTKQSLLVTIDTNIYPDMLGPCVTINKEDDITLDQLNNHIRFFNLTKNWSDEFYDRIGRQFTWKLVWQPTKPTPAKNQLVVDGLYKRVETLRHAHLETNHKFISCENSYTVFEKKTHVVSYDTMTDLVKSWVVNLDYDLSLGIRETRMKDGKIECDEKSYFENGYLFKLPTGMNVKEGPIFVNDHVFLIKDQKIYPWLTYLKSGTYFFGKNEPYTIRPPVK